MSFYSERILPHLLNLAMRHKELVAYRRRALTAAWGRVLDVGIGSGPNLPFYGAEVDEVIGLDPSHRLLAMAQQRARSRREAIRLLQGSAEAIPLDSASVDTVVTTWTLCSIPKVTDALTEMRRVLKPNGTFLFVEHGLAPDTDVRRWQDRLTPLWRPIAGGCHLNRPMADLIRDAGFVVTDLKSGYMGGPRPFTFMYEGSARRG